MPGDQLNNVPQTDIPPICEVCGKVKRQIREGSLTSWIFAESRCQCEIASASQESKGAPEKPLRKEAENASSMPAQANQPVKAGGGNYLSAGTIIGRHYQIVDLIGEGGMSRVYKALHLLLNRVVAIKYINPKFVYDAKSVRRFQQEAQAAAGLKHPNICAVNEFGIDDEGLSFLVMDYVEGLSLSDLLKQTEKLEPEMALDAITQICEGLAHAHSKGIVHRDIKPANIVLSKEADDTQSIKLVDFGIAKLTSRDDEDRPNLTKTGDILGTPYYMSPEQCLGKKVDARSDIYSVGCVFYELLTGKIPFDGDNAMTILLAHVNSPPPTVGSGLPSALERVIERCLKKDPSQRYQHVKEILLDLEAGRKALLNKEKKGQQTSGLIGDRYQIVEMLGQGGMGTVLKARHLNLNKFVAIKVLTAGKHLDETSKKRFEQEAQSGSRLSHPNLVSVFDYGFADDEPYLVMEFVEGESLEAIAKQKNLTLPEFLDVFIQLCKVLQYIHKNGIVHRDLKTSNIMIQMIESERYVKLLDFGIAKVLNRDGGAQGITSTGMVFGSPLYMSPEQCMGKETDARSDIYSLGCVMYECIAGRPPFEGENSLNTLFKHMNDRPPRLTLPGGRLAEHEITAIVEKCLEKVPQSRYQSAGEVLAALNSAQAGQAKQAVLPAQSLNASLGHARQGSNPALPRPQSSPDAVVRSEQDRSPHEGLGLGSRSKEQRLEQPRLEQPKLEQPKLEQPRSEPPSAEQPRLEQHKFQKKNESAQGAGARKLRDDVQRHADMAPTGQVARWRMTSLIVVILCVLAGATPFMLDSFQKMTASNSFEKAEQSLKQEHWQEAQNYYLDAVKDAQNRHDNDTMGRISVGLGTIALHQNDVAKAKEQFSSALKLLDKDKTQNRDPFLDALVGQAETQMRNSVFAESEKTLSEARDLAKKWGAGPLKQGDVFLASAQSLAARSGKIDQIMHYYDDAIAQYSELSEPPGEKLTRAWIDSAELCAKKGWNSDAARRAMQGLQYSSRVTTEVTRDELRRRAEPIASLDAASAESRQSTQAQPAPSQASIPTQPLPVPALSVPTLSIPSLSSKSLERTQLEEATEEANLEEAKLNQVKRAQASVRELGRIQDENFKRTTELLKQQNRAAYPASP